MMNTEQVAGWLREAADRHILTHGEDVWAEELLQRAAKVEAMRCGHCRWWEAEDLDKKDFCMSPKIQNEIYGEGPDFGCIYFEMREGR